MPTKTYRHLGEGGEEGWTTNLDPDRWVWGNLTSLAPGRSRSWRLEEAEDQETKHVVYSAEGRLRRPPAKHEDGTRSASHQKSND